MPLASSLSPSGLASIDATWGGFARGGTYLLVEHPHASGFQHLLAMTEASMECGEKPLLVSRRPQNLQAELAAQIGLDLPAASQSNQVQLVKSPTPDELATYGDLGLAKAFKDLIQLAQMHGASRVLIDDFSSFAQFRVFEAFVGVFRQMIREATAANTTFVLLLREPAEGHATDLLNFLKKEVARTIYTQATEEGDIQDWDETLVLAERQMFERDLRAAREAGNLTLEQIHRQSRLAKNLLLRFEAGKLVGDPTFTASYLRAFLRSYASAVGIPPKQVESALQAVWKGSYFGELHPSFACGPERIGTAERLEPVASRAHHESDDPIASVVDVLSQADKLPLASDYSGDVINPESGEEPSLSASEEKQQNSVGRLNSAWGQFLQRLNSRTETGINSLTTGERGSVSPSA